MDWTTIGAELTAAVDAATLALLDDPGSGDLYAIALSVAEDGMGIGLCWTTETHFRAHLASESQHETLSDDDAAYYRWAPAEWSHETWRDDLFAGINATVSAKAPDDGLSRRDFKRLIDVMIEALAALREAQSPALANTTLFVTVTDSEDSQSIENRSAAKLNPRALHQAFAARYGAG